MASEVITKRTAELPDHLVEGSEIRLEIRELLFPTSLILRFARIEALSESRGVEILGTCLLFEPRPGVFDVGR
jgi:hypothetical protein